MIHSPVAAIELLTSPFPLGPLQLRNRICMPAMHLNFTFGGGDSYNGNRRGDYGSEIAEIEEEDAMDAMDATEELIIEDAGE